MKSLDRFLEATFPYFAASCAIVLLAYLPVLAYVVGGK